jgi:hypothetical protein
MTPAGEPVGSYFDTTLGAVSYNVPPAAIPDVSAMLSEAVGSRHTSSEGRSEFINLVRGWVGFGHYPLMVHEWCHVLQAVSHPALYLRCLREYSAICTIIDILRKDSRDIQLPFTASEPWGTDLVWSTTPLRLSVMDGMPAVELAEKDWLMPNDLSETDLLEDAASIMQYKAEVGSQSSVNAYRRWLRERGRHRYSRTFDFVAKLLSPADAYVALPPLVMSAYMTAWPLHGFVSLLALTVREAPAPPSEMGIDECWRFLERCSRTSIPGRKTPDPRRSLRDEGEQGRIEREGVLALVEDFSVHPLSPLVKRAWSEEAELERLQEAILHPYRAFDRTTRRAHDWLEPYRPPITTFRVAGAMEIGDTVVEISPTVLDSPGPNGTVGQEAWLGFLFELMRMKAFVFSAATPLYRAVAHNCPHLECPFHRYDMCRTWQQIPRHFEQCDFPGWLTRTALRRMDFNTDTMIRVDNREAAANDGR